jgi:very-short-patch-repair endonuclease
MSAVATDAEAWNAENSNAASAETLTAAGIRAGRVLVKAGASRLVNLHSSKDCRSASDFQAPSRDGRVNLWAMPAGRVRSQQESGMDCPLNPDGVDQICESPIERRLVGGLIGMHDLDGVGLRFLVGGDRAAELPAIRDAIKHPGLWLHVFPQEIVGPYRADFLVVAGLNGRCKTLIVECDGREFHQDKGRDWERDRFMQRLQYRVVRITGAEIWRDPVKCARAVVEIANRYLVEPENEEAELRASNREPLYPAMQQIGHHLKASISVSYWNWLSEIAEQEKKSRGES